MFLRICLTLIALALPAQAGRVAIVHPQDGPHADIRVTIEDDVVRFAVGVNLAFLDEVVDVPREALGELSAGEADRVLAAFRELLEQRVPCVINGERVAPDFERLEIFTDPDPGMVAIFHRMGTRALIRATAIMRFDAADTVETVELTWPAYPYDQLAQEMEPSGGARPRMYFEAVLTAGGKSSAARFAESEPTLRWSRKDATKPDPLQSLPAPRTAGSGRAATVLLVACGAVAVLAIGFAAIRRTRGARVGAIAAIVIAAAGAFALQSKAVSAWRATPMALIDPGDAEHILRSLHESLYRAFDYTAESDIYDRLEVALEGELLGELYEQIRLSLVQAEKDMKVGIVTGLEPIETTISEMDLAGSDPEGRGFDATHRWRVDGTVYHWGHSHTRANVYEARYRVAFTQQGWQIVEHTLLSQERVDPIDGSPAPALDPIRDALDRLGRPDF